MTIAGGYPRHSERHQMDRHRRLGVGGPRRVRRLQQDWRDIKQLPEEPAQDQARPVSTNHTRNFLDSVKSRQPTITPVETAHHSAIPGHLGLISMLVGRKLKWDAQKEIIVGDPEASKLLGRPYRMPWNLRATPSQLKLRSPSHFAFPYGPARHGPTTRAAVAFKVLATSASTVRFLLQAVGDQPIRQSRVNRQATGLCPDLVRERVAPCQRLLL